MSFVEITSSSCTQVNSRCTMPTKKCSTIVLNRNSILWQRSEIVRYPEKKTIGKLNSQFQWRGYAGELSILDEKRNKWIGGKVVGNRTQLSMKYTYYAFDINWNGTTITLDRNIEKPGLQFRDADGLLLADFTSRVWPIILGYSKYDVKIYSNAFPEQIYLLVIAASDRTMGHRRKG